MDASILDYDLPKERIAQLPAQRRDNSRLLVYRRESGEIEHRRFSEIADILPGGFSFIRNNAAVLKARIFANRKSALTKPKQNSLNVSGSFLYRNQRVCNSKPAVIMCVNSNSYFFAI